MYPNNWSEKKQAWAELCQAPLSQKLQLKLQSKSAVEAEVIPYFSGWVVGGGWVAGEVENIAISAFNKVVVGVEAELGNFHILSQMLLKSQILTNVIRF